MQPDEEETGQAEAVSQDDADSKPDDGDETPEGQELAPAPGQAGALANRQLDLDSAINEVDLDAYAILGTASMPVSQLLRMGRGAVVELETGVGDQIDLTVNGSLVARGEVVVVEDRVAVKITDLVSREQAGDKAGK
ncbi:MAG: FliM/FliN family flagellar motor switch protein [Pseudomonadota bacterium]